MNCENAKSQLTFDDFQRFVKRGYETFEYFQMIFQVIEWFLHNKKLSALMK
jgi:hypothetical protein